jgi:hypothetical protein
LCYIFVVPKGKHQFVACFGVLGGCETAGFDAGGETIIWQ